MNLINQKFKTLYSSLLNQILNIINISPNSDTLKSYQIAFYGFDSKKSKMFNEKDTNKKYEETVKLISNNIARGTNENDYHKYKINDERWLLNLLKKLDKNNFEALFKLPEIIICPYDVKFSKGINQLLCKYNIKVQRIDIKRNESDNTILSIQNENDNFKNAIKQIEKTIVDSKIDKYRRFYKHKFKIIQQEIDNQYGKYQLENVNQLYSKTSDSILKPIDMNIETLLYSNNHYYDINGNIVDTSSLELINKKIDILMSNVLKIYKEKDETTYNHIIGMLNLIPIINSGLDNSLTENEIVKLYRMVILHDIGKLVIPSPILDKKDKLNNEEFEIMKTHVNMENVCLIQNEFIHNILQSALLHHKNFDGKGGYYDNNLKSNNDKLTNILSVLDIYNALSEKRSYKDKLPYNKIIEIMNEMTTNGKLSKEILQSLINGINKNISFEEINSRKIN